MMYVLTANIPQIDEQFVGAYSTKDEAFNAAMDVCETEGLVPNQLSNKRTWYFATREHPDYDFVQVWVTTVTLGDLPVGVTEEDQ